jgi:hypothetical protein
MFLAWKEGFVRADYHVVVFFLYAFLVASTMPALLRVGSKRQFLLLPLTAATLVFAQIPFTLQYTSYLSSIRMGALPKLTDTFTALFAPAEFKRQLEVSLESMRETARLPQIAAMVVDAPLGVLNYNQDVAILNGFNYRPHPVFQNYSAYTPELQSLNLAFFDSEAAPEWILWRFGTIDRRFPTLDDGQIILRILDAYVPVTQEKECILWRRKAPSGRGYSLNRPIEVRSALEQWIPIPNQATWLKLELHETWFGAAREFLCRASVPRLDVRLEDGQTMHYRLPPGYASSGFVVNPLFPFFHEGKPVCVTGVRVCSLNRWCFDNAVRVSMQKIEGIPELQFEAGDNRPQP